MKLAEKRLDELEERASEFKQMFQPGDHGKDIKAGVEKAILEAFESSCGIHAKLRDNSAGTE